MRVSPVTSALAGLSGLFFASTAFAALEFKASNLELPPAAAGVTKLTAEFPFTNTGENVVTIREITSTCGCTVPEIAEKTYAAGASGVVKAVFEIGGRQGRQTKQVTVKTDAGEHVLAFSVELPQRLLVTPRLHVFRADDKPEQIFAINAGADIPLKNLRLGPPSPNYTLELIEKKAGTDYEVRLKLASNAPANLSDTLYVYSIGASGIEYTDSFFIRRMP